MARKTAIVIGVGAERGLGAQLCRRFATKGLHVFVAGRTPEKIRTVADGIGAAGGAATAVATDTTVEGEVLALFDQAEQVGPVDLAIFNAGGAMPGDLKTMEAAYFELCWRVACFGGFLFGREAARRMAPRGTGTLLFTGASASMRGKPFFAAFTAAKAGLRAFAQSMAREFQPQGIHVGHVVIDGAIDGDRFVLGRPDIAQALGADGMIDLGGIVDVYEFLYDQPRRAWSHEVDVRTFKETF